MKGVAHVSFPFGGMFLPARSPSDRWMLAQHVTNQARVRGEVQILLDDQRWLVHFPPRPSAAPCPSCGSSLSTACVASAGDVAYCAACACGVEPRRGRPGCDLQLGVE